MCKVICRSKTVFQVKNIVTSFIVFFFNINIMKQKRIGKVHLYFPIIKLVTCRIIFIKKAFYIAVKFGKIFSHFSQY